MTNNLQPRLFAPITIGSVPLKHRVVMAPLTRRRASQEGVPSEMAPEYYTQRATDGGLIITEATFIAQEAGGLEYAPGIYSAEQIEQWKKVTSSVHAKGGKIFMQLWALGRVASPSEVKTIWSAGTIPCPGAAASEITQMSEEDIERFVDHYRQAALNAIEAGMDGVEIHGANGYLLDQFIQSNSNNRTDSYGGTLENRFRFPLKVLNAVCEAVGADRVGIRMSPFSRFQGMREEDPLSVFIPWTKAIVTAQPKLAYIHAVEGRAAGATDTPKELLKKDDNLGPIREITVKAGVALVCAGGFNPQAALEHAEQTDDLVAFGRYFISNPDLPERIRNSWELNQYDRSTFYTRGPVGYVDIPPYQIQTTLAKI